MSKGGSSGISRRAWVATASGAVAAGLIRTQGDAVRLLAQEAPAAPADPTKVPGRFTSEVGARAPGEQPHRLARTQALSSASQTPLQDLMGIITPSAVSYTHLTLPTKRIV